MTVALADEIDVSRGDVLAAADHAPELADHFAAHLVWMDHRADAAGAAATVIRIGSATATAQITDLGHRVNVDTLEELARQDPRP